MKSKHWFILIGALLLVSCGLGILFSLPGKASTTAEIWSDNQLVRTVDLRSQQSFTVETEEGYNVIKIENGRIAIIDADCPDHLCMHRGFCNGSVPIVCLPHRLVIKFIGEAATDGVVG